MALPGRPVRRPRLGRHRSALDRLRGSRRLRVPGRRLHPRRVPPRRSRGPWRRRVSTVLPTDVITISDDVRLYVTARRGLGNVRATELDRSRTPAGWTRSAAAGGPPRRLFQMPRGAGRGRGVGVRLSTGFQRADGLLLQRVRPDRTAERLPGRAGARKVRPGPGAVPTSSSPAPTARCRCGGLDASWRQWRVPVVFDAANYRMDADLLEHLTSDLDAAPRATRSTAAGGTTRTTTPGVSRSLRGYNCRARRCPSCTSSSASGTPGPTGPTGRCSSGPTSRQLVPR